MTKWTAGLTKHFFQKNEKKKEKKSKHDSQHIIMASDTYIALQIGIHNDNNNRYILLHHDINAARKVTPE